MRRIKVDLLHCYGIKKLNYEFNFTNNNACIVYAPNGTMKTSFTKMMKDLKNGIESNDRIYKNREYKRIILNETNPLSGEDIVVFESLDENFESDKITNLIVNKELKIKYDKINNEINLIKNQLLKLLAGKSGISVRGGLENVINQDFEVKNIFESIENAIKLNVNEGFKNIKYKDIVNEKIENFLKNKEVKLLLKEYIDKYDELLDKSTFFKKGLFDHNNAADVAKNLGKNKYFNAKNKLIVEGDKIIENEKELLDLISDEKDKILNDSELMKKFNMIDVLISKNIDTKKFRLILENNKWLIRELDNFKTMKKKFWSAYIKLDEEINQIVEYLINVYYKSKEKIADILKEARKQSRKWEKVINIYNSRFDVPFKVAIENQEDVILKEEKPSLIFKYVDEEENEIRKNELLKILSRGEQRALYILNIIFEIEALKEEANKKLIILDDIADSFDYKNKYAIVEYLKDIKEENKFRMIIFTHNFDFYRTLSSRIELTNLMTIKNNKEVKIVEGGYTKDVFKFWKSRIGKNERIFISSIPFVRNICDYTDNKEASKKLTNVLHIKQESYNLNVSDILEVFNSVWTNEAKLGFNDMRVLDLIMREADKIISEEEETVKLENKIVLSIAIRLLAEIYMIDLIDDDEFTEKIKKDQTKHLFDKFKKEFEENEEEIKLLSQVNLMTAENIHINAFMYEPLLDMATHHLKNLYIKIKCINSENYRESAVTRKDESL